MSQEIFLIAALFLGQATPKQSLDPQHIDFFEKRVRPVLVENCVACHGSKKQNGGLRLDSRKALLEGGDNGPVVVPGQPDKSPLVAALSHAGQVKMPPKGKLPADAIEAL